MRDKTLPAHPKWPNLAHSTHAGRVLYRSHHQEAGSENFVPNARQRSSEPTRQRTRPTGVKGTGGTGVEGAGENEGPARGAGGRRRGMAGLRDATQRPPHTNFAHNFPRSLLEIARKRCNPNNINSIFETRTGELRAKLLRRRQDHRQPNFACNSPTTQTNTSSNTAEYQRLDFNT